MYTIIGKWGGRFSIFKSHLSKVKKNNNIIESMKRLPEGATHMDYVSQSAVMSNRLLGRRGGFGSGFLGGMFAGSSLRIRI